MNILVFLKNVPDLVEELEIGPDGRSLDRTWLRYIVSEYDEHALEQAILLKERHGGSVTVMTCDRGETGDALFTAVAKGADRVVRIACPAEGELTSSAAARIYAAAAKEHGYDLILTGVHAIDDLEGPVGARLAVLLGYPYAGVVSGIELSEDSAAVIVQKEFPGGLTSRIELKLPAVIGIQSASQPPRYVPIAKIRQASKTAVIDEVAPPVQDAPAYTLEVRSMSVPETGAGAEMLEGDLDQAISRLMDILSRNGITR
jgi:electron transfer flavoprotein beta subunit